MGIQTTRVARKPATRRAAQIACGVCGESTTVSTRRQFSAFDEMHRCRCGASWVSLDLPLQTILDLPAY